MVKKIILSLTVVCLFIAIPLALMGYKYVELGTPFLALMKAVNNDLKDFTIAIPEIPKIPRVPQQEAGSFLEVLVNILNVIINFFNSIITIVNILVQIINIFIQLIQVIVLIIKNIITFKDTIASYNPLPIL